MSKSLTGWICSECQRRVRARLSASIRPRKRGFVSLSETGNDAPKDDLEDTPTRSHAAVPQGQRNGTGGGGGTYTKRLSFGRHQTSDQIALPDAEEDVLIRLFKSSGREPPKGPVTLKYSQTTLQSGDSSRPIRGKPQARLLPRQRAHDVNEKLSPEDLNDQVEVTNGMESITSSGQDRAVPQIRKKTILKRKEGHAAWPVVTKSMSIEEPVFKPGRHDEVERAIMPGYRWNLNWDSDPLFDAKLASKWPFIMRTQVKSKDLGRAEAIWRTYELNLLDGKGPKDEAVLFTDLTLFLHWAVEGRLTKDALSIWRTLQAQGFQPRLRHWTMMLRLAGQEHDLKSIRAVWQSIKQLDERPDNRTWSVLLADLCGNGEVFWHEIREVFEEMFAQWNWLETAQGRSFLDSLDHERQQTYGPSVVPFNSALFRALGSKHRRHVQELLDWMQRQGVKPSVTTFNILMKTVATTGDTNEVRRLMLEMRSYDILPDKVTFTAVLDGVLRRLSDALEPDDVGKVAGDIQALFDGMDEIHYMPSHHTYATALSALLSRQEPIVDAARVVLEHMERNHVEPTVYILTILVKHYMRPENPQVGVAEAVYHRAQAKGLIADRRFYDAMIQGYAACAETDKMLRMLRFLPRTGHTLSWASMHGALELLVAKSEFGAAVELVEDLEQGKGMGRYGCWDSNLGENFWAYVDELRDRGQIPVQQTERVTFENEDETNALPAEVYESSRTEADTLQDKIGAEKPMPSDVSHCNGKAVE